MKKIIGLISLLLISNTFSAEFLTNNQKIIVLEEIDNICGDTWCEGDFNFSFNEITCDSKTQSCQIEMDLIDDYNCENEDGCDSPFYSGTCSLANLNKYEDMIDESRRWRSLNDDFYFALSDCISDLESEAYVALDL